MHICKIKCRPTEFKNGAGFGALTTVVLDDSKFVRVGRQCAQPPAGPVPLGVLSALEHSWLLVGTVCWGARVGPGRRVFLPDVCAAARPGLRCPRGGRACLHGSGSADLGTGSLGEALLSACENI